MAVLKCSFFERQFSFMFLFSLLNVEWRPRRLPPSPPSSVVFNTNRRVAGLCFQRCAVSQTPSLIFFFLSELLQTWAFFLQDLLLSLIASLRGICVKVLIFASIIFFYNFKVMKKMSRYKMLKGNSGVKLIWDMFCMITGWNVRFGAQKNAYGRFLQLAVFSWFHQNAINLEQWGQRLW